MCACHWRVLCVSLVRVCVCVSGVHMCCVTVCVRVSVPGERVCLCHQKPKKRRTKETPTAIIFARHRTLTLFFFCMVHLHTCTQHAGFLFFLEFHFRLGDFPTAVVSTRHQTLTLFLCVVSLSLPSVREGVCMNVRVCLSERE